MRIVFKNGIAEIIGEQYDDFDVTVEENTTGTICLKIQTSKQRSQNAVDMLKWQNRKPVVVQMKERGDLE